MDEKLKARIIEATAKELEKQKEALREEGRQEERARAKREGRQAERKRRKEKKERFKIMQAIVNLGDRLERLEGRMEKLEGLAGLGFTLEERAKIKALIAVEFGKD